METIRSSISMAALQYKKKLALDLSNETLSNLTAIMSPQLQCQLAYLDRHVLADGEQAPFFLPPRKKGNCGTYYDGIVCWPESAPGELASTACPDLLEDTFIEAGYNATRYCLDGGKWASKANYSTCKPMLNDLYNGYNIHATTPTSHLDYVYYFYWAGYSISLVFLTLAFVIFCSCRRLWCVRNFIHINLQCTFICHNLSWLLYSLFGHEFGLQLQGSGAHACIIPTTILKFFTAAGFFWMFVEGGYLFVSVRFSFSVNRIRLWMCCVVGWAIPFILILITSFVKGFQENDDECWNENYHIDYIFIGPILFVLLANVVFLLIIMSVVFSKLHVNFAPETARYRKTLKALLILCPLLGVNYVLVIIPPSNPGWLKILFAYVVAGVSSLQGLLVAIFFCFFSSEVKQIIFAKLKCTKIFDSVKRSLKHSQAELREKVSQEAMPLDANADATTKNLALPAMAVLTTAATTSHGNNTAAYLASNGQPRKESNSTVITVEDVSGQESRLYLKRLSNSSACSAGLASSASTALTNGSSVFTTGSESVNLITKENQAEAPGTSTKANWTDAFSWLKAARLRISSILPYTTPSSHNQKNTKPAIIVSIPVSAEYTRYMPAINKRRSAIPPSVTEEDFISLADGWDEPV